MIQKTKNILLATFSLLTLLLIPFGLNSQQNESVLCDISINRSAVPALNFNNLTLLITVNDATNIQLTEGDLPVDFKKIGSQIIATTEGSNLKLLLTQGANTTDLCQTQKAALLKDRQWAWSHGFDDNAGLLPSIQEFRAKSWPATMFLIAGDYEQNRMEPSFKIDEPYMNQELIPEGWVIGNHTWSHERFNKDPAYVTIEDYRDDIRLAQTRLEEGIDRSSKPDLKIITFASPNFSSFYDTPLNDVAQTTDLRLLEVGNDFLHQVGSDQPYINGDLEVPPFGNKTKIGRDGGIESSPNELVAFLDSLLAGASSTDRFWYNSLTHGGHELNIKIVIDHVWDNYGPNATDSVWVASSAEVYSYILTRDNSVIAVKMKGAHPLTVTVSGEGSGTVSSNPAGISCDSGSCQANFAENQVVTLTATSASDSQFESWGGACENESSSACMVTISQAQAVTANFKINPDVTPTPTDQAIYLPIVVR